MAENVVAVRLTEEEYRALERIARERGYTSIAELVKDAVRRLIEETPEETDYEERLLARLERRVLDLVNPYTEKIDSLARRIAELQERLEDIEERVRTLQPQEAPSQRPRRTRSRRSALERLRADKIVLERDVGWLRNKDAFFEKLRRQGAVVLGSPGERIAVDADFWRRFLSRIARLKTRSDEEILSKGLLEEKEYILFSHLKTSGLIYYDEAEGKWRLVEETGERDGEA